MLGLILQLHPVGPAHQTAGLQQARGAQTLFADQKTRSESDAAGKFVRFGIDHTGDDECRRCKGDAIADLQIQARQQRRIRRRAISTVALRQHISDRHVGHQGRFTQHGIIAIDRFQFDQRELAVLRAHHGAQRRRRGDFAPCVEVGALGRRGFALDQRKRGVAAQQCAAFTRQSIAKAGRDRTDTRDRHHAERDACDEHIEAAQAAAQFTKRIAQRQQADRPAGLGALRRNAVERDRHEAAVSATPWRCLPAAASIWPERRRTTRPQRRANAAS